MNKVKFLQKAAFTALLSLMLISCGTSLKTGIQEVKLGMSKSAVTGKLGNDYEVVSMVKTEQGNLEVLRYTYKVIQGDAVVPKNYYILHFLDDKLVELNYEDPMPSHPHRPHR